MTDFNALSMEQLEIMAEAGRKVVHWQRVLAKTGDNVVGDGIRSARRTSSPWAQALTASRLRIPREATTGDEGVSRQIILLARFPRLPRRRHHLWLRRRRRGRDGGMPALLLPCNTPWTGRLTTATSPPGPTPRTGGVGAKLPAVCWKWTMSASSRPASSAATTSAAGRERCAVAPHRLLLRVNSRPLETPPERSAPGCKAEVVFSPARVCL